MFPLQACRGIHLFAFCGAVETDDAEGWAASYSVILTGQIKIEVEFRFVSVFSQIIILTIKLIIIFIILLSGSYYLSYLKKTLVARRSPTPISNALSFIHGGACSQAKPSVLEH
jgi:hypothetical protein